MHSLAYVLVFIGLFGILRSVLNPNSSIFILPNDQPNIEPVQDQAAEVEPTQVKEAEKENESVVSMQINVNDVDYTFRYIPGREEASPMRLATYFCEQKIKDFPDQADCSAMLAAELERRMQPIVVPLWVKIGSEYTRIGFEYINGMNANFYAKIGAQNFCRGKGIVGVCENPVSIALAEKFAIVAGTALQDAGAKQVTLSVNEVDYVFGYSSIMEVDAAASELARNFCATKGKDIGLFDEGDSLEKCEKPINRALGDLIIANDSVEIGDSVNGQNHESL